MIRGSHLISISVEYFASLNSSTLASTVPSDGHGDRGTKGSDDTDGTPALVTCLSAHTARCGEVQAWVIQNITFSRLPSGKRLARTRMRSDGDDLGDKGRANSPP